MKKLLFLLLLPFSLIAQEKGSTKIMIQNELSAKQNYDLVLKTLLDNDYFIETKDTGMLYIKTQPKAVNKHTGLFFLNIRTLDNQIQLSGMFKTGIEMNFGGVNSADNYEAIIYRGMKGSLYRDAFNQLDLLASKVKGNRTYN